jgi:hypothetical protein
MGSLLLLGLLAIGCPDTTLPLQVAPQATISPGTDHAPPATPTPHTETLGAEDHVDSDGSIVSDAAAEELSSSPLSGEVCRAHSEPFLDDRHRPPELRPPWVSIAS